MSTYWDVYCKDCGEKCGIDNANHGKDAMLDLIRNRHGLAAMAPVLNDLGMRLDTNQSFFNVCPSWFEKHHEHRLAPINEYGDIVGDVCASCKQRADTRELSVDRVQLGLFCETCRNSLVNILKESMPLLHVWELSSGKEVWVVAATEDECWGYLEDQHGDADEVAEHKENGVSWTRLPADKKITLMVDEDGDVCELEHGAPCSMPAWVWAVRHGAGFLAETE